MDASTVSMLDHDLKKGIKKRSFLCVCNLDSYVVCLKIRYLMYVCRECSERGRQKRRNGEEIKVGQHSIVR